MCGAENAKIHLLVHLNGNPFLFEKAVLHLSKAWHPRSKNTREDITQIATPNIVEAFNIDWNTIIKEEENESGDVNQ